MKTPLSIIGAALILIAGGLIAMMARENSQLSVKLAESEARAAQSMKEVQSLKVNEKKLSDNIAAMSSKLGSLQPATASAGGSNSKSSTRGSVAPLANQEGTRLDSAKPMKALSEMMKNPAMREMAKAQQVAMMDMQYGPLFDAFQFTDEEKANFKQLLSDRLGIDTDMGMKLMDDTLTPEQRKAVLTEINDQKKQSNDRIRSFLNSDEDYKTFEHFENTKGERTQLSMGKAAFASAPLSPQQEIQLVDAMHEATMAPSNIPNLQKPENFDPRKFTPADIDAQLKRADDTARVVLASAQKFLSPAQMEALKQSQASWRAMQEASLKMMGSMMGGK